MLAKRRVLMSGIGEQNYPAISFRIEAALLEEGPLTTPEILRRLKDAFSEAAIRTALRFLVDENRITRPSQKQRWEIVRG